MDNVLNEEPKWYVLHTFSGYENMVQEALLSVVKKSLIEAATKGLTGDHHFYISFSERSK